MNRLLNLALVLLCFANASAEDCLHVSPHPGSEAGGLNISHPELSENVFDFRTCEAVLDGNRDFGLFRVKLALPGSADGQAWFTNSSSKGYQWRYPEGVEVHLSLMPHGEPPIHWAWWINATNTFDEPLIALQSRDGRWTAGLSFERAAWASANTGDDRACFHLFPAFGRIEPGGSATTSGAFWLLRGSPEDLRRRIRQTRPSPLP